MPNFTDVTAFVVHMTGQDSTDDTEQHNIQTAIKVVCLVVVFCVARSLLKTAKTAWDLLLVPIHVLLCPFYTMLYLWRCVTSQGVDTTNKT